MHRSVTSNSNAWSQQLVKLPLIDLLVYPWLLLQTKTPSFPSLVDQHRAKIESASAPTSYTPMHLKLRILALVSSHRRYRKGTLLCCVRLQALVDLASKTCTKADSRPLLTFLPTTPFLPFTLDTSLSVYTIATFYNTAIFSCHLVSPSRGQSLEKDTSIPGKHPHFLVRTPTPLPLFLHPTRHSLCRHPPRHLHLSSLHHNIPCLFTSANMRSITSSSRVDLEPQF